MDKYLSSIAVIVGVGMIEDVVDDFFTHENDSKGGKRGSVRWNQIDRGVMHTQS